MINDIDSAGVAAVRKLVVKAKFWYTWNFTNDVAEV